MGETQDGMISTSLIDIAVQRIGASKTSQQILTMVRRRIASESTRVDIFTS